jgi:predicted DNA-binding transcriptional regulator AlpA
MINRSKSPAQSPFLVSAKTAAELLDISKATFWRRVQDGTFPKPLRIQGATRWNWRELEQAIADLSNARASSKRRRQA